MKKRMAIYKYGYVHENGDTTDNKFIKAYFNYATAFKELEILGADYFCQEEEFDNLTKEWVSNETEPITI